MKKMNIGLVGAGFMGKAHMVAFSKKDMGLKKHVQTGWILSMILKSIL